MAARLSVARVRSSRLSLCISTCSKSQLRSSRPLLPKWWTCNATVSEHPAVLSTVFLVHAHQETALDSIPSQINLIDERVATRTSKSQFSLGIFQSRVLILFVITQIPPRFSRGSHI
ncbi:hypothetical protein BJX70DRAFT_340868 [Aspergillus crustosus]